MQTGRFLNYLLFIFAQNYCVSLELQKLSQYFTKIAL